jgi:hypothetical protein
VQRSTPGQAYRALPKAGPARTPHGYYRLRYDHVDAGGKARLRCHACRDSRQCWFAAAGAHPATADPADTAHLGQRGGEHGPALRQLFAGKLRRYLDGQPLLNVVDRSRGY